MRIYLLLCLLCLPLYASSQSSYLSFAENGTGFDSHFQNMKRGDFEGEINGMLQLKNDESELTIYSFSQDSAHLNIEYDENEIYDVSFKRYFASNGHVELKYTTYGLANALSLTLGSQEYSLSLIDGACDMVIAGLEYQYLPTEDAEFLILNFTNSVGLSSGRDPMNPDLSIQKGSSLILKMDKST